MVLTCFNYPNFIYSPQENEDKNIIISFIIDHLTNQLYLNAIIVYLLLMLTIIIISKLYIDKEYKFEFLNKYPLGSYLSRFLSFYISTWQKSNNVWIFFILFIVIFFNGSLIFFKYFFQF